VPADAHARATITQKQPGVLFGFAAAEEVFRQAGAEGFEALGPEGQWREEVLAQVGAATGSAGLETRALPSRGTLPRTSDPPGHATEGAITIATDNRGTPDTGRSPP